MLKLLIDARMIDSSGIGTYLQNLIPFLKKHMILYLLGDKKKISKYIDISEVNVIPMKSSIYFPLEQVEYILKVKDVDVFWSPHFNVPIFPVRAKKRIVTIHDVFHLAFKDLYNLFERSYAKLLIDSAVRFSDLIITVSQFSKSEILKHTKVKEDKIKVIYNGVDTKRFKVYPEEEKIKIKNKYNLPDKFLFFVGNVKPHKNLKGLLRAFERIIGEEKNIFLVITGKKEGFIKGDKEIFKILNNRYLKDRVIFTGYMSNEDLPLLYNLADIFVFPSLYEGFGLPPLEAMACGCPSIVSKITPLMEICGDAVYYVDPYDVEDMAKGIMKVLKDNNLKEEMKRKGYERVNNFSWEKSAIEHLKLINEIFN
jgi:glycosyltransferase involved in cell wall biosynthesis